MRNLVFLVVASLHAAGVGCGASEGGVEEGEPIVDTSTTVGNEQSSTGPARARGSDEARTRVGSAGGTLELANGVRLEIPAGALTEPVEVVLRIGPQTQVVGRREGEQQLGPPILVEPAMVAAPGHRIVVSMPLAHVPASYETEDLAVAIEQPDESRALDMGGNQTRWQVGPVSHSGGRLSAEVDQLFGMRFQFLATH